ncbi:winged helix-turn-helix transcriptional regulator [Pseudanabaena sp. PCC 6802]|uniref:winged helix-turn-helix transcriptional regulator n=1 Tax=Pseudanabaena sp. PCC 6802 TaxID=118173 RepID=UPI000348E8EF|nr:helix-turn-helix domain-containing protein [Pseudanabaena sp. PCC 6802]
MKLAIAEDKDTALENIEHKHLERSTCPVECALKAIGGRWKVLILRELFLGTKRFGELHRALHGITQKMLTQQLRELEQDGIVSRYVYQQVPPKVEYSLTGMGQTLKPILDSMHAWGLKYLEQTENNSSASVRVETGETD